jgi:3-phosphoshikimate 1-carboxyvinyltransferase
MLEYLGADVTTEIRDDIQKITIDGHSKLMARNIDIPADISSAAFFLVAAAGVAGSDVKLPNVGINPTRSAILEVLVEAGVNLQITDRRDTCNEPRATLAINSQGQLRKETILIKGERIANLIDEAPILAVFGTLLPGGLEMRNARELRVKESDRIAAIVENLAAMGADVEEFEDGFSVKRGELKGARIRTYGDHRIAMAFSIAALFAKGETVIEDPGCASVSLPGFFELLDSLSGHTR